MRVGDEEGVVVVELVEVRGRGGFERRGSDVVEAAGGEAAGKQRQERSRSPACASSRGWPCATMPCATWVLLFVDGARRFGLS